MIRKAKAVWVGAGRTGCGDLSTVSGVLNRTGRLTTCRENQVTA